jgi:Interferon-induced 6-16 family
LHVGRWLWKAAVATVGAGVTIVAAPAVISFVGFTSGGIAAGSWAASMMSAAAVANGGAIAAGSTVATLQSIGAAGLGYAGTAAVAAAGAATSTAVDAVVN